MAYPENAAKSHLATDGMTTKEKLGQAEYHVLAKTQCRNAALCKKLLDWAHGDRYQAVAIWIECGKSDAGTMQQWFHSQPPVGPYPTNLDVIYPLDGGANSQFGGRFELQETCYVNDRPCWKHHSQNVFICSGRQRQWIMVDGKDFRPEGTDIGYIYTENGEQPPLPCTDQVTWGKIDRAGGSGGTWQPRPSIEIRAKGFTSAAPSSPHQATRKDPTDGQEYTLQQFKEYYGDAEGQTKWDAASPCALQVDDPEKKSLMDEFPLTPITKVKLHSLKTEQLNHCEGTVIDYEMGSDGWRCAIKLHKPVTLEQGLTHELAVSRNNLIKYDRHKGSWDNVESEPVTYPVLYDPVDECQKVINVKPEIRRASDGGFYTWIEFDSFYKDKTPSATNEWTLAQRPGRRPIDQYYEPWLSIKPAADGRVPQPAVHQTQYQPDTGSVGGKKGGKGRGAGESGKGRGGGSKGEKGAGGYAGGAASPQYNTYSPPPTYLPPVEKPMQGRWWLWHDEQVGTTTGQWKPMDEKDIAELERRFCSKTSLRFNCPLGEHRWEYEIDVTTEPWKQRNPKTGRARMISRTTG